MYGSKNKKRSIANHKSSSMKVADRGFERDKNNIVQQILNNQNSKDISLPYIQSSHSANPQLVNPKDAKWSPSKRKDKRIVAEHTIINNISAAKNPKPKRSKLDISKASGAKPGHKFVAIYSNSNS